MTEFIFWLKIALINIRCNRLLCISKFFSSLFCMFFALLLIGSYCGGIAFVRERCDFKDAGTIEMYVAEDISKLPRNPGDAEHFIVYAQNDQIMFKSRYLAGVGIMLTDIKFADLFENFCAKGEYISDAESECVLGNAIAEKYNIKVSDKINIGARKYTVRGITANAGYRSTILLCDPRGLEIGCPQIFLSTGTIYGDGLKFRGEHIRDYFTAMMDISDLIPIAALCAAMLVFSTANVFDITIINAKRSALTVRIHRSLGACRKTLFAIRFAGNLIINVSAFAMALIMIAALKKCVLIVFSTTLEFSFLGVVPVFLLAVLLSLIYSLGMPKKEGICSI